ncbi:metallophosphoesterase [Fibrobacterota bacterium]
MKIFALSDPHLSFSTPEKKMDRFGEEWTDHPQKIRTTWEMLVSPDDAVLVPGDISWAKKFEAALADLHWIDTLPGKKIILKGNHDFWWPKKKNLLSRIPSSIHIIQNNHFKIGKFVFFGSRLWDTKEYTCDSIINWDPKKGNIMPKKSGEELEKQEKIYERELGRLRLSLQTFPLKTGEIRIGMCHFPPLDHALRPSRASRIFSEAGTSHVVFGHLHSLIQNMCGFGMLEGTCYHLASSDFLDFKPKLICED